MLSLKLPLSLNRLTRAMRHYYAPLGAVCLSAGLLLKPAAGFQPTIELSALDGAGFRLNGRGADQAGRAIDSAGDVNNDGIDDFIIGGNGNRAWVVFGRSGASSAQFELSTLDGVNGFLLLGAPLDGAGLAVSGGHDLNGDDIDDVVVGAPYNEDNQLSRNRGRSYVVFGRSTPSFPATLMLTTLDGNNGFIVDGVNALDRAGHSLDIVADINGDDLADLLIGAPGAGADRSGQVHVIFGRSVSDFPARLNLSELNGSNGFTLTGDSSSNNYEIGFAVSAAGDVNGDSIDDIIVGARKAKPNGPLYSGQSYVIFGRDGGFSTLESLSALNGTNGFVINGEIERAEAGRKVGQAGDINGDGFDDVAIGTLYADPYGINPGKSYLVFGHSGNFSSPLELSSLDGNEGFVVNSAEIVVDADPMADLAVTGGADFNNDGIDDLIIGAQVADVDPENDAGRSYILFGRSTGFGSPLELSNFSGSDGVIIDGIYSSDRSGFTVSLAGDVNNDNLEDLLIGAPLADPNYNESGQVFVVFGRSDGLPSSLNASALDGANGFVVNGRNTASQLGISVSGAGDLNGDGIDEVIVGAPFSSIRDYASGESFVLFGRDNGFNDTLNITALDASDGFVIAGNFLGDDQIGYSVSVAGDVNGDNIDDLIFGARRSDINGINAGQSYVLFGNSNGFPATFESSSINGSNGFIINGANAYNEAGYAVSAAGDVNGDGIDDVIIGEPGLLPDLKTRNTCEFKANLRRRAGRETRGAQLPGAGRSHVIFGRSTGFTSPIEVTALDGANGFTIEGINAGDRFGCTVSDADDVNNDGFDDIIIGAPLADPNGEASGQSYLIFGRSSFTATINAATLNGNDGVIIDGETTDDQFGNSVSGAGDINQDGFDDIIIGAPNVDSNGTDAIRIDIGRSYLIFGRSNAFPATLALSTLDGSNGFVLNGAQAEDKAGSAVSKAGDINGDTIDDVIIGAPYADPNGNYAGASYVVFGKTGSFDTSFELTSIDGNNGFRINGIDDDDYSGSAVHHSGDVNGDGVDDIVIGARYADPNGLYSGQSYVVFGTNSDLSISYIDAPDPVELGSTVQFTFTAQNQGPTRTTGVEILFSFPAALGFAGFAPQNLWICTGAGPTTCRLQAVLEADTNAMLTLTFNTNQVGQFTTTATINSNDFDAVQNNNQASQTTTVLIDLPDEIFEDQFE